MLPNFLIIGAPRAGTTWIAKNIREHPDIYIPQIKEIHFFDRHYGKGINFYESYFPQSAKKKAIGEATPDYLYEKGVPALIHKHLPNVKLVLSLRNPVDRVYSRYWNAKAKYKQNKNLSFEEKIRLKPLFLEEGFYYDHLLRFFAYFPKEQFLILLFDDLKKDPNGFLQKIFNFLDVDASFTPSLTDLKVNAASTKGPLAKSKVLWYLHRAFIRLNIIQPAKFIEKINDNPLPVMDRKTKEWLVNDIYKEKNIKLANLLRIDLSDWNRID